MAFILALDEGTTSARAIVFDRDGNTKAIAQKEFTQKFPQPGWVEHDAEEIWAAQIGVAVEATNRAGISVGDLAGIGITNQRETTVVWDRQTGKPVGPAIVWQDRRTAPICDRLRAEGFDALVRERTGLVLDAYFSGTKVAWILDNVPGARQRAEQDKLAFGTIDSWLVWNLTGGKLHLTDVSNASRTLMFNIHTGAWDADLLERLNVPASLLPQVRPSSEVYGNATVSGLTGVPIAGIAGDQQAALFGQCCYSPGMTKNTYGTGCFMLQCTGNVAPASTNNLITTVAWQLADKAAPSKLVYALEGSVFIGGAVVQWLRDGLKIIRSSEDVNALAATVPDNGGVYFVPAFAGLGAPHWDSYARGSIFGLTRGSTNGHIARAALEAIAFQSTELLDAMQADMRATGQVDATLPELRVDGGACRSDLLMQIQADLLGVPVARPVNTETTALGAAYLAGLAVGYWKDQSELESHYRIDRRFEPKANRDKIAELKANWQKAIQRSKAWSE